MPDLSSQDIGIHQQKAKSGDDCNTISSAETISSTPTADSADSQSKILITPSKTVDGEKMATTWCEILRVILLFFLSFIIIFKCN